MKVGFILTNYNNSSYSRNAIKSIFSCNKWNDVRVVIVDNKSQECDIESLKSIKIDYPDINLIFNDVNLGYFKGLNVGIEFLRNNYPEINHIVIGNNDLVFPEDFIVTIQANADIFKLYPVISPDIITLDGIHQNPHVIFGISKIREFVWDLYYRKFIYAIIINYIAKKTRFITERKDYKEFKVARPITQGYGACYILGSVFFENFDNLWSPTFLMGEEFFLSQQLKNKKLQIYYEPKFKVQHYDHATMGKLSSKALWEITKDYHEIYKQYKKPF
jgi:GT2 family glycosyltransferase